MMFWRWKAGAVHYGDKSRGAARHCGLMAVDVDFAAGPDYPARHPVWRRSSAVEQGNHNPLVGSSNLSVATRFFWLISG